MKVAVLLCALALAVSVQCQWTVVDNNYETIAMSLSFQQPGTGWVGGGSASLSPLFLYTTDGGKTFDNHGLADSNVGAFLSIDVTADGKTGVAGGFGFLGLPCGAYMQDGNTWNVTHAGREIVCAAQDADAVDKDNLVITGVWVELTDFNGDGLQVSTDGGKKWKSHNWNQGTNARYSSFPSSINNGFVTGGIWPSDSQAEGIDRLALPRRLSRHLLWDGKRVSFVRPEVQPTDLTGYVGIIAQATNGAKDFKTLVNLTNQGLYFNEISCVDDQNCWAAAEGVDKTTLATTAWVYHTSDGWNSYDVQLTAPMGSIIAINMLNSTFGWAGGAIVPAAQTPLSNVVQAEPDASVEGTFWQTTDGTTWQQYPGQLKNFYVSDISTVDASNAYAAGLTAVGLSSFAAFSG